jgi:hypothetical protein
MSRFRQDGIARENGVRKRSKQPGRPRRKRVPVRRAPESGYQRAGVQKVSHGFLERIALRTFRFVAAGASVLTVPSRVSQGDPCLPCTAWTRCRTALRANSLRSSPTASATFCQTSFSWSFTRTVSMSLIHVLYYTLLWKSSCLWLFVSEQGEDRVGEQFLQEFPALLLRLLASATGP